MLGMAQPNSLCSFLLLVPMPIPSSASCSPAHALSFAALFFSCFLHVLLIFPSPASLAFLSSTVISLVTHHILYFSALICPFLHLQVTVCLSSLAIPLHSAQAGVSCCLQTVSPAQTLSTLRCYARQ